MIEGDNLDRPVTRGDLRDLEKDLKNFMLEREIVAMRWIVGIQITYFGITLAAVWFLVSHH